jgi:O-antigen ligase
VSIGKVLSEAWHLSAKQSILPISLICGMLLLKQRYGKLPDLAFAIATYVTFYTIYCIAQRYFGLDWVRGFSSVLPDNRFAYGVYRISGLMGHPLSLAYNLVFAAILFGYFGFCAFKDGQKSKAFWWYYCTGLVLLILALSGSRWPLLVAIAVTSFLFVGQLFKRWKIILLAASLLGAGIYFEGSVVNRFSEIFEDGQIKTDKIPRLVFWKIHSKMFVDDPVWGVGYSARNLGAVDYYNKNGYNNIERKYSAHNQYLQVLADGGLVGFVVIFGFWVWLLILFNLVTDAAVKKVLYMILMVVGLSCLMKNVLRDTEFLFGLWLLIAFSYTSLPLKNNMRT